MLKEHRYNATKIIWNMHSTHNYRKSETIMDPLATYKPRVLTTPPVATTTTTTPAQTETPITTAVQAIAEEDSAVTRLRIEAADQAALQRKQYEYLQRQNSLFRKIIGGVFIALACLFVVSVASVIFIVLRAGGRAAGSDTHAPASFGTRPSALRLSQPAATTASDDSGCAGFSIDTQEIIGPLATSTIPICLGQLTQLTYLDLWMNQLTGTIPTELGLLTRLTRLDLSGNFFDGTIPTELGRLAQLGQLSLYSSQLVGTLPTELGELQMLTALSINHNLLEGTIPSELRGLTSLQLLYLQNNRLTGPVPSWVSDIEIRDLYGNKFDC